MIPMKRERRQSDQPMAGTLSLDQLARRWHKSRKEVRWLLADRIVDFVQIRGHVRVPKQQVEQYERSRLTGPGEAMSIHD